VASLKNPHPGQRNDIDSKTDLIQTLPKERTAFVIAHRFHMDIIYVLEGGRILEAIRFYSKKKTASTGTCTMP
jgi:ABC-type transport system involved in cytochrome bd biosynthesis fused ATPase/permease subunit